MQNLVNKKAMLTECINHESLQIIFVSRYTPMLSSYYVNQVTTHWQSKSDGGKTAGVSTGYDKFRNIADQK